MPINQYGLPPDRIGKSLGRIIGHAMPVTVLGTLGQKDNRKRNTGIKTVYRRMLPKGATTEVRSSRLASDVLFLRL